MFRGYLSIMDPIYRSCFIRDNFKCRHCGDRNAIHPHHVIYRSHRGKNEMNNIITLCAQCHLEGVHQGKLHIDIIEVLENDVVVKFTRLKGWKPK